MLWCSDSIKKRLRILCVRALEKATLMFLTSSWPLELLAFQVDYMLGDNPRATRLHGWIWRSYQQLHHRGSLIVSIKDSYSGKASE
ncbi:hypothetical protein M8C21_012390 [Ambrosia artemisiifolia]|uniref:Uncharacterized protein n=1 Tax=Ambrosia artemisiifolia TaxID=4212 RepID=A0AAD5CIQ7_AMBAR|nr:hypothetical protein M8C21_012390 [Ambrosia artemisiifolia]